MNETYISAIKGANHSRRLPQYTKGEEIANMVTHILGGVFALFSLLMCTAFAAWNKNIYGLVSGVIYGISMIVVYVVSSVYHGLDPDRAYKGKVVLRVLDHCDIYGLIVGTFVPIALTGLRQVSPVVAWTSLCLVILTAIIGTVFTAIDFSKFRLIFCCRLERYNDGEANASCFFKRIYRPAGCRRSRIYPRNDILRLTVQGIQVLSFDISSFYFSRCGYSLYSHF